MGLDSKYTYTMPVELVNMVIDYVDYDKHYRREHKNGPFLNVIADLIDMSYIFPTDNNIRPAVSSMCWGKNNVGNIYDIVEITDLNNWAEIEEEDWGWDLDSDEDTPEWA